MTNIFPQALKVVLTHEGVYSDDLCDKGGKTKFGITEKLARSHGYTNGMKYMPISMAEFIYKKDYWDKANLDKISALSVVIAIEIFDSGVNCGIARSAKWFQKALNVMSEFSILVVDGLIGDKTIEKLRLFNHYLDVTTLMKIMNTYQAQHYIDICKQDRSQLKFIRGWFNRVDYNQGSLKHYERII